MDRLRQSVLYLTAAFCVGLAQEGAAYCDQAVQVEVQAIGASKPSNLLFIPQKSVSVMAQNSGDRLVLLRAQFLRKHWDVACTTATVCPRPQLTQSSPGEYSLWLKMNEDAVPFGIALVGPRGETENFWFLARIVTARAPASVPTEATYIKSQSELSLGLSPSWINYQETDVGTQTQLSMTVKLGYTLTLGSSWSFQFANYFTAFSMTSALEDPMRFLGINLRVGYHFPEPLRGWRFALHGGAYYLTTFVNANAYGYSNLLLPQIYPTLSRELGGSGMLGFYLKFSPIVNAASLDLGNREIAAGAFYRFGIGKAKVPLTLGADLSSLNMSMPTISASSSVMSIGISMPLDGLAQIRF